MQLSLTSPEIRRKSTHCNGKNSNYPKKNDKQERPDPYRSSRAFGRFVPAGIFRVPGSAVPFLCEDGSVGFTRAYRGLCLRPAGRYYDRTDKKCTAVTVLFDRRSRRT